MVFRSESTLPHTHHLDLTAEIAEDIRRNLARLGMMRALTVVTLAASGAYRVSVTPVASVRPSSLAEFGISLTASFELIDDLLDYDTASEAAVLVVETNPIDGVLATFLVQDLGITR